MQQPPPQQCSTWLCMNVTPSAVSGLIDYVYVRVPINWSGKIGFYLMASIHSGIKIPFRVPCSLGKVPEKNIFETIIPRQPPQVPRFRFWRKTLLQQFTMAHNVRPQETIAATKLKRNYFEIVQVIPSSIRSILAVVSSVRRMDTEYRAVSLFRRTSIPFESQNAWSLDVHSRKGEL